MYFLGGEMLFFFGVYLNNSNYILQETVNAGYMFQSGQYLSNIHKIEISTSTTFYLD